VQSPWRDEQLAQAKRWAKFPATVLFALCVLWLVQAYTGQLASWTELKDRLETGIGVAAVLLTHVVIPLGSAIAAFGLLTLHRWAYPIAGLLPILPLVTMTTRKIERIGIKFHAFHNSADGTPDISALGGGIMDSLILLGAWCAFALMLWHLYKSWQYLYPAKRRQGTEVPAAQASLSAAAVGGASAVAGGIGSSRAAVGANSRGGKLDEGDEDTCFLLPETQDDAR
jgi:hypothetical protein